MTWANRLLSVADIQFAGGERWRPINDQQATALECPAQALMFGGGSGGGKTDLLIGDAAQERNNRNLRALLIRRSFTEMTHILDRTRDVYSQMGATYSGTDKTWRFPSSDIQPGRGAQIQLGYIDQTGDIGQYQGIPRTYVGADESTYLKEASVRNLIPWLVSTDPAIKCRLRLCTNPGQVGADWHMHVFLNDHCPVHFPLESVRPYQVYRGSTWTDGTPTKLTTCFIPSLAIDNPLYGQEKLDRLESLDAGMREKLLTGCWCALEGAYFKFLRPPWMMPYAECGEQWWWKHIISIDYGFGGSWAAGGLYGINEAAVDFPQGRMFKIGEMVKREVGSTDFATMLGKAFVEPTIGGERRQFEYAVCDPAMDAHTGTGKSNFDMIQEVLEDLYGISCIKAAKDRIGNAQNLYRMLKSGPPEQPQMWKPGQLVITDAAPITFSSLCTRMHDAKHPGDILKMKDDSKDDLYDETSYGANTFFSSALKPKDVANSELLAKYKAGGMDEYSLNIHRMRMEQAARKPERPISLGRRHGGIIKR